MTAPNTPTVGMICLDSADAATLANFYKELLGLDTLYEGDGYFMIGKDGTTSLGFDSLPDYTPPSWPDEGRKQFHLDLAATDPAATVERAIELGATKPDHQPGERWTVLLDPAGHPFCVTDAANWG